MYCKSCGSKNHSGANFCMNCGDVLASAKPKTAEAPAEESTQVESAGQNESGNRSKILSFPLVLLMIFGVLFILLTIIGQLNLLSEGSSQAPSDGEEKGSSVNQPLTGSSSDYQPPEIVEEEEPSDSWVPLDFKALNSEVAYQSLETGEMNCGFSTAHSCFQAYFTAKRNCKAFVTVSFLVDGVKVDKSIESAFLEPGTASLMSFVSFDRARYSGEGGVKFERATCY